MFKLLLSITFAFALLSCASSSSETEMQSKSKWSWNCCSQEFGGTFTLAREGTAITGVFYDSVAKSGSTVSGTYTADSLLFVRTWDTGSQQIQLALTKNGQSASGVIFGSNLVGRKDMQAIRIE